MEGKPSEIYAGVGGSAHFCKPNTFCWSSVLFSTNLMDLNGMSTAMAFFILRGVKNVSPIIEELNSKTGVEKQCTGFEARNNGITQCG